METILELKPGVIRKLKKTKLKPEVLLLCLAVPIQLSLCLVSTNISVLPLILLASQYFKDNLNTLTKKDQIKTGLSMYLEKVRYIMHISLDALCRVAQLDESVNEEELFLKYYLKVIMKFISYEYPENHLGLESDGKAHICTYTVNNEGGGVSIGMMEKSVRDAH